MKLKSCSYNVTCSFPQHAKPLEVHKLLFFAQTKAKKGKMTKERKHSVPTITSLGG